MKRFTSIFLILVLVFSFHAPVLAKEEKEVSVLDKRAVQTKIYETKSENELMKMALNVVQDENYKIINLDNELSLVTAMKQTKKSRPLGIKIGYYTGFLLMSAISFGIYATIYWVWIKDAHTPYNVENTITLNVSDLNEEKRKIRINGYKKVLAPQTIGQTTLKKIEETEDKFYQDFFYKMDKESFITKQDL